MVSVRWQRKSPIRSTWFDLWKIEVKHVSISSKQHQHSNFNLTLLDVVDALCPAAPAPDPPLDYVLQHRNASGGFRLFKLDLRRGGESSHLDDGRSRWDLWEHVKNNCPLEPNDSIHTVPACKLHTISNRWRMCHNTEFSIWKNLNQNGST